MKLSTLIMCASSASISVADAKRFSGRGLFETTEGLAERRLEEFEMSIPMPTEESPAESIEKLLKESGVDEAKISTVMKALDGGAKMTGGKREECAAGVKMIFLVAALLPGELLPGLETLIDLLLCGPKEEETVPEEPTCVVGLKEGDECTGYGDQSCCDGLICDLECFGEVCRTDRYICQEAPQCALEGEPCGGIMVEPFCCDGNLYCAPGKSLEGSVCEFF